MDITSYIKNSIAIIKTYTIVLWITALISGMNILNLLLVYFQKSNVLSIPTSILTFVSILVIYGLYYEIIEDKYTSMKEIFSKYLFGYLIVSILINIPAIIVSIIPIFFSEQNYSIFQKLITIVFNVIFIYVVPFFYKNNEIYKSILHGVMYLISNMKKSLPIIIISIIVYTLKYILSIKLLLLISINAYLYALILYLFIFGSLLFEYSIFIVLILVITNKEEIIV